MEFDRPVTDRIHERSGGVPRLINVIADATLVFGYGEERSEIDSSLVEEVIADLDTTGVLGPQVNANRRASVVPADPVAAAAAMRPAAISPAAISAIDEQRLRDLADRELQLKKREEDLSTRERELAEQRRVLADQYRLLRSHPLEAKPAAPAAAAPVAAA